jgi:hypothetical protein
LLLERSNPRNEIGDRSRSLCILPGQHHKSQTGREQREQRDTIHDIPPREDNRRQASNVAGLAVSVEAARLIPAMLRTKVGISRVHLLREGGYIFSPPVLM